DTGPLTANEGAQLGSARRELGGILEVLVQRIIPLWNCINIRGSAPRRGGNLAAEHGGHRPVESKGVATPTFQEAEKVLRPAAVVAATGGDNPGNDSGVARDWNGDARAHRQSD